MAVCVLVARQKLLITPCALVPVPILSYTVLTIENCRNPSHTPAHKHGKRKDFSVLCNEGEHHEPHDIMDVHGKFSSPHCTHTKWEYEQRKLLTILKPSSVTNH